MALNLAPPDDRTPGYISVTAPERPITLSVVHGARRVPATPPYVTTRLLVRAA